MIDSMYNGGRIALLGFLPPSTEIDWDQVIFKGLNLKGIFGREMFETWYKMSQIIRSGVDVSPSSRTASPPSGSRRRSRPSTPERAGR